jgi:Flp pilus assembly protein CpaB
VFAALGVVLALAAFVLVQRYSARARGLAAELGDPVSVAAAARGLARGTVLDTSMLQVRSVPAAFAPPGSVHGPGAAAGRVLLTSMEPGELLTADRLAPRAAGPVAAMVPSGLRAVPVRSALGQGAIRAGDRVDVLATFPGPRAHTETVASGLQVLRVLPSGSATGPALGTSTSNSAAGLLLMLLSTPDQAEQLAYAQAFADISVTLEGPEEVVSAEGP